MDIHDLFGRRPNRPDHPDFWRISDILLELDADINLETPSSEIEARFKKRLEEVGIDEESLHYSAMQRAFRAMGVETVGDILTGSNLPLVTAMMGCWVEAFQVGVLYERKDHSVAIDLGNWRTVPFIQGCRRCDNFRGEIEEHYGLFSWVQMLAKHFERDHGLVVYQHRAEARDHTGGS